MKQFNTNKFDLLFERFISSTRNEPSDIDVDFEHERREEVIQYVFNKYGRYRAAIIATVTQVHQKGAIRDMRKDTINGLSASIGEFTDEWFEGKRLKKQGLNSGDQHILRVLQLTREYMGFPRQLGQHTGGFVITRGKLSDLCSIMNTRMADRTCIVWNIDDIDALGFMKIDVLPLGMLTCIRKAFNLAHKHYGLHLTLANIPQDDPAVYGCVPDRKPCPAVHAAQANSMPMGFYQPAQLIGHAVKHSMLVKPVDVNYSVWDNQLQERHHKFCVIRLGFRQVKA